MVGKEVAVPGENGVVAFDAAAPLLAEYMECKKALAYWKDRQEHVKERLVLALGEGNEVGLIDGREVFTFHGKDSINTTALKKDHPDLFEVYQKPAEGTVLDTKMLKLARPDIWAEYQVREVRVKWDG